MEETTQNSLKRKAESEISTEPLKKARPARIAEMLEEFKNEKCCICYLPLKESVLLCENSHVVCSHCLFKELSTPQSRPGKAELQDLLMSSVRFERNGLRFTGCISEPKGCPMCRKQKMKLMVRPDGKLSFEGVYKLPPRFSQIGLIMAHLTNEDESSERSDVEKSDEEKMSNECSHCSQSILSTSSSSLHVFDCQAQGFNCLFCSNSLPFSVNFNQHLYEECRSFPAQPRSRRTGNNAASQLLTGKEYLEMEQAFTRVSQLSQRLTSHVSRLSNVEEAKTIIEALTKLLPEDAKESEEKGAEESRSRGRRSRVHYLPEFGSSVLAMSENLRYAIGHGPDRERDLEQERLRAQEEYMELRRQRNELAGMARRSQPPDSNQDDHDDSFGGLI